VKTRKRSTPPDIIPNLSREQKRVAINLAQLTKGLVPEIRLSPIPKMPRTLGQATGDRSILAYEKIFFSTPVMRDAYKLFNGHANEVILDTACGIGFKYDSNLNQLSIDLANALEEAKESALEKRFELQRKNMPTLPKALLHKWINGENLGILDLVYPMPQDLLDMLNRFPEDMRVGDVVDLCDYLRWEAAPIKNRHDAENRQRLANIVEQYVIQSVVSYGTQAELAAMQELQEYLLFFKKTFLDPPLYEIMEAIKAPAKLFFKSQVATVLFETPRAVEQAQAALGSSNMLRNTLVNYWFEAAKGPDGFLSKSRLYKFFNQYRAIFRLLYPDDSAALPLKDILSAVTIANSIDSCESTGWPQVFEWYKLSKEFANPAYVLAMYHALTEPDIGIAMIKHATGSTMRKSRGSRTQKK
jgi:hypothetical protein